MTPDFQDTMIFRKYMARVRVRAGRLAGRQRRFDETIFEICESVAGRESCGVRPSHEHRIFPVTGRGRRGQDHRQPGTEEGGIEARRPVRMRQECEQTSRANPYKLALGLLKHPDRQLSGAAHWGRSTNQWIGPSRPRIFSDRSQRQYFLERVRYYRLSIQATDGLRSTATLRRERPILEKLIS